MKNHLHCECGPDVRETDEEARRLKLARLLSEWDNALIVLNQAQRALSVAHEAYLSEVRK